MKEESIMQVDVDGDYITVTMTGTSFRSTYFKAPDSARPYAVRPHHSRCQYDDLAQSVPCPCVDSRPQEGA